MRKVHPPSHATKVEQLKPMCSSIQVREGDFRQTRVVHRLGSVIKGIGMGKSVSCIVEAMVQ